MADWRAHAGEPASSELAPFPLRAQTEADLKAARWGLLVWEDPRVRSRVLPFWADVPMLEAKVAKLEESDATALFELVRESGATYAGLRVRDGTFIPYLERGRKAEQVKVIDAEALDPARSRLVPVVPVDDFPPHVHGFASKSWLPSSPCEETLPFRHVVLFQPVGLGGATCWGSHVLATYACRRKPRDGRQTETYAEGGRKQATTGVRLMVGGEVAIVGPEPPEHGINGIAPPNRCCEPM